MTATNFRELANGLLYSLTVVVEKVPSGPAKERAIAALEEDLLPIISHLVGPGQGPVELEDAYRRVIQTGRVDLMRRLVAADNEAAKHVLQRLNHDTTIRQCLPEAQPELLIYLAQDHQALPFELAHMMAEAARREDIDLFMAVADPYHPLEPFWSNDIPSVSEVLEACGPAVAPELSRRLKSAVQCNSQTVQLLGKDFYLAGDIKIIASLLCAGINMSNASSFSVEPFPEEVKALLSQSGSAHGRIALMTQDGSLEDMLGRPTSGGSFYGMTWTQKTGLYRIENDEMIPLT